jgi:hypothetical protein
VQPLVKEFPDQDAPKLILAEAYGGRKDWKRAVEVYSAMWEKGKGGVAVGNNLAYLLVKHFNSPANAEKAYEIAQQLRTNKFSKRVISGDRLRAEFLDTLGVIYRALPKPDARRLNEAKDLFEAARRRYQNDARVYLYLADAYAGLAARGVKDARRRAEELYTTATTLAAPDGPSGLTAEQRQEVIQEAALALKRLESQ